MTQRLQSPQYTLADYFQIANSKIPHVFKSFNPDRNSQALPPPDPIVWSQIVELYNTKRQHQLVSPGEVLTPAQIELQMTKLAKWIRSYLYPAIDSEFQDELTDRNSQSPLDLAIEREDVDLRIKQQSELETILTQHLANLRPERREILQLFYRDGLSQQALADRFTTSQSTISRRIRQAEAQLLAPLLLKRSIDLS